MRAATNIKEAAAHFTANRETIPVAALPKGDYAFEVNPKNHLYLVVERKDTGILLARITPDFIKLKPLSEEEQKKARDFAYQRLQQAGLL